MSTTQSCFRSPGEHSGEGQLWLATFMAAGDPAPSRHAASPLLTTSVPTSQELSRPHSGLNARLPVVVKAGLPSTVHLPLRAGGTRP